MRKAPRPWSALFLAAVVSCSASSTGPQSSLVAARNRWAQHAPSSYSMVVSRSCECLPAASGAVLITVRNGVVASRRYVASGADVPPQYAAAYPTVVEMFVMIEDAVDRGVRPLDVRYATLGYPTRIALGDPAADAPVITVSDFHSL